MGDSLSHLNKANEVHIVDVVDRPQTRREAIAEGVIHMQAATLAVVLEGRAPKGDVLAVARVAAIQAAKRTSELIPLCHSLPLSGMEVKIESLTQSPGLRIETRCRTINRTGVEMEALTGVSVGLLTLFDMLKALDPAMTIDSIQLIHKDGGRNGAWNRNDSQA
ncbi:MAG TPA: cyclic pyranopterin monophosphate synthase MoaC [Prochlorococcus sp.]|jgi:cyclic pyranopterin phosphate synthase